MGVGLGVGWQVNNNHVAQWRVGGVLVSEAKLSLPRGFSFSCDGNKQTAIAFEYCSEDQRLIACLADPEIGWLAWYIR